MKEKDILPAFINKKHEQWKNLATTLAGILDRSESKPIQYVILFVNLLVDKVVTLRSFVSSPGSVA